MLSQASTSTHHHTSSAAHQLVCPPPTFAIVENGIYRSGWLEPPHASYIRNLSLKTCLIVTPERPTRWMLEFLEGDLGVKVIHLGLTTTTASPTSLQQQSQYPFSMSSFAFSSPTSNSLGPYRPIPEELVKEGIELILNAPASHPALICCASGCHETGAFIGCLRRLQGWNFNSIVVEYRMFAGSKSRMATEQFIELFDVDLITLPPRNKLPYWLVIHLDLLEEEREAAQAQRQAEQRLKNLSKLSSHEVDADLGSRDPMFELTSRSASTDASAASTARTSMVALNTAATPRSFSVAAVAARSVADSDEPRFQGISRSTSAARISVTVAGWSDEEFERHQSEMNASHEI